MICWSAYCRQCNRFLACAENRLIAVDSAAQTHSKEKGHIVLFGLKTSWKKKSVFSCFWEIDEADREIRLSDQIAPPDSLFWNMPLDPRLSDEWDTGEWHNIIKAMEGNEP